MKIKLLACTLFLVGQCSIAQEIHKGKIITSTAALEGYISTSVFDETPQEFKISDKEKGDFRTVNSSDILKVQYDNGTSFEKHVLAVPLINKDYFHRTKEDYTASKPQAGNIFVQQVLSGGISLYLFKDQFTYPHFFYKLKEDTALILLMNEPYVDEKNNLRGDNAFKEQLSFLLRQHGCENKIPVAQRTDYELLSLLKTAEKINECMGTPTVYNERKQKGKTKLILDAAGGFYQFRSKDNGVISKTSGPAGGITLDIVKSGGSSYRFLVDILGYRLKSSPGFNGQETRTVLFQLAPGMRVYLSEKIIKPFLEGSFALVSYTESSITASKFDFDGTTFIGAGLGSKRINGVARFGLSPNKGFFFAGALLRVGLWR